MSNHNHDNMDPDDIKPPPRMSESQWEKYEHDKNRKKESNPK